nr:type VI secretion system-associated FHA domain protein TagH [uncultured Pseudomonas sp.]
MPLKLTVKSYGEQAPVADLFCLIDQKGTLGRALGNDLVLEDSGKYISRSHARVECREGDYYLIDTGSNPSVINEKLLGNGREALLREGDQLLIGDYLIQVNVLETEPVDPDQTGVEQTQTLAVFNPPPVVELKPPPPLESEAVVPLTEAGFSKPELQADALANASILQGSALFDPASNFSDPLGLNVFGPGHTGQHQELSEHTDPRPPFQGFRSTESDHLSPELQALPTVATPISRGISLIPDGYDALADLLTPTHEPRGKCEPVPDLDRSATPTEALTGMPKELQQDISEVHSFKQPPKSMSSAQLHEQGHTERVAEGDDDQVLKAMLAGMGLPDLRFSRSPQALARLVGEMLREATEGTMGVLMARALTKRESHIDMTMIGARSNNPLKFFPDPASALSQMLSTDASAYLTGVQALNAAFDDLRAHELAVIAGMREALSEVVQRFEPARIESCLTPSGAWDRLVPRARKARLWDRLTELYSELVRDGDEDLQRIFGQKFSTAYQQQVARLRDTP